jgi:peptidoglycan-N-acetylglucosamine deacetylase
VRTLARRGIPATFFLTGRWARRYPMLARAIGARFPVGNHTYDHPYLTRLSDAAVAAEIHRGARAIRFATRRDPRPLFRFPYGDSDARTIAIANRLGYVCVRWTVDTLGWIGGQTVAGAVRLVVSRLRPGAIVLMHAGGWSDARALPAVIAAIRSRGYGFTTLAALGR